MNVIVVPRHVVVEGLDEMFTEADSEEEIVIVNAFEVAGLAETQVSFEDMIHVTISPSIKAVLE